MPESATVERETLERIASLCHRLPTVVVESICEKITRSTAGAVDVFESALLTGISEPTVRAEVGDLLSKWLTVHPESNAREFAHLLRGAAAAEGASRSRQDLELVWTGPAPANSSFRKTEQALLEVIDAARSELWIVSFASYKVPAISAALLAAAKRGVRIRLVLESKEESDGKLTFSALRGLGSSLAECASVYLWPRERRPSAESGAQGALHAKCAVADSEILFVSSANLTEYAMTLNMEMGVLIRGSALPERTSHHLDWLVETGVLQAMT